MMNIKCHIANFFTLLNSACGFLAIIAMINGDIITACYLVILGGAFDFLDGFVARALNVCSELGKQLDSLSDMVTFGAVPGLIAYHLLISNGVTGLISYTPVLVPVFSGLRLGKFNLDERQTTSFLGLPTPANGLFWISLPLILNQIPEDFTNTIYVLFSELINQPAFVIGSIVITSAILVSELPLFGFKFKNYSWADNKIRFSFIIIAIALLIIFHFAAIPIILILYILFSIINNMVSKNEV